MQYCAAIDTLRIKVAIILHNHYDDGMGRVSDCLEKVYRVSYDLPAHLALWKHAEVVGETKDLDAAYDMVVAAILHDVGAR